MEDVSHAGEQNDIGYNIDAGDRIQKSLDVYVGEPVAQSIPGRGRIGYLDPDEGDSDDCYRFSVCEEQTITASLASSQSYDFELINHEGDPVGNNYIATKTSWHFIHIFANEGAGTGYYTFDRSAAS